MSLHVLILGANGFIGSHLCTHILVNTDWKVMGLDISHHKLKEANVKESDRFHFVEADALKDQTTIETLVKAADVVLPLVAIANPSLYVNDPLRVFELDFESNLAVVRLCVKHHKRVIFPSTSEVYGMCSDKEFKEYESLLVQGPVSKPRWIYSCSKQLLDRVIIAYGLRGELNYTLFRPFNWMGPRLDDPLNPKQGSSRAFSQFLGHIIRGEKISLVGGGQQRRAFIYIDDAIDALMRIIHNNRDCASQRIFNIGNPQNDVSIKTLAEKMVALAGQHPAYAKQVQQVKLITVHSDNYFGEGYQDIAARVPSVQEAKKHLGWIPKTNLDDAIRKTLDYYSKYL